MLNIKNYHFLILFICLNIFSTLLKQVFKTPITDILLIITYLVYTFTIIHLLNNLFQSLNKYLKIYYYLTYIYLFYGVFYGLYLQVSLGEFEFLNYIESFNQTIIGSFVNTTAYISILFSIPFLLTKVLLSCEKKEVVKVFSYTTDFLKFIIPPIAIWLMVPRINKVYENSIAENEEDEPQIIK